MKEASESQNTCSVSSGLTHFGYKIIPEAEKEHRVARVFNTVACKYDLMNDIMSLGLHRLWKSFTIGRAAVKPGMRILDVAGGTGDMAYSFARRVGYTGEVWLTDINTFMLKQGRDRIINSGLILPIAACDAEHLPFPSRYFDRVCVAFGLRNITRQDQALLEMRRVLKIGGKLLVLDFSHVVKKLDYAYDWYLFNILPWLGKKIANDEKSYQYLAESIKVHPDQETLSEMMNTAGLNRVRYFSLTCGIVALHEGVRL